MSDAEATEITATDSTSSAGDYSLSIIDFQRLWYDSLQDALRLADQIVDVYKSQALSRQPVELLNQIGAYIQQRDEFYYDVSDADPEL